VAGSWIREHQLRPLPRLLEDIRSQLADSGVPVVEQVWDAVCNGLPENAGLLYRLLGEHPGPTFSRASATALIGLGPEMCDEALEHLGRAGLVDLRAALQDRGAAMRMPELLRAHARRRARQDLDPGVIELAQTRVLRWLTRQGQRADLFAAGERLIVGQAIGPMPGAPDLPLEDPREAVGEERAERALRAGRWLNEERHTLFACVRLAHARAQYPLVVALCEPVWTYALDYPHQSDVVEVFRLGVDSAVRAQDVSGMVRMRCQLARWLWEAGRTGEAGAELGNAVAALTMLGNTDKDTKLRASAIEFRGMFRSMQGDWVSAAADFVRSRELHTSISNSYGVMLQTYRLGQAQAKLGDNEAALDLLTDAHDKATALGRERVAARTGFALGHVLRACGRAAEARRFYQEALDGARRRCSGFDEARALDALAELADEQGHADEAERHRSSSAVIRRRNGAE
jgi:tetratricopeptide (TPR) repeat protein